MKTPIEMMGDPPMPDEEVSAYDEDDDATRTSADAALGDVSGDHSTPTPLSSEHARIPHLLGGRAGDNDPAAVAEEPARRAGNPRARALWRKAARMAREQLFDVSDASTPHPSLADDVPPETVERHRWINGRWVVDVATVRAAREPFAEGSMRVCYHAKKMSSRVTVRHAREHSKHAQWKYQRNYVLKTYKPDKAHGMGSRLRAMLETDVVTQAEAKELARAYNGKLTALLKAGLFDRRSPKPMRYKCVDMLEPSLVVFVHREGQPALFMEAFVAGEFNKYNDNAGFVSGVVAARRPPAEETLSAATTMAAHNDDDDDDENTTTSVGTTATSSSPRGTVVSQHRWRATPQAFSHFTFVETLGRRIVVDVQGVGDLFTDPQIHTDDGLGYGRGNGGLRGIALFFATHRCNRICRCMRLPRFFHAGCFADDDDDDDNARGDDDSSAEASRAAPPAKASFRRGGRRHHGPHHLSIRATPPPPRAAAAGAVPTPQLDPLHPLARDADGGRAVDAVDAADASLLATLDAALADFEVDCGVSAGRCASPARVGAALPAPVRSALRAVLAHARKTARHSRSHHRECPQRGIHTLGGASPVHKRDRDAREQDDDDDDASFSPRAAAAAATSPRTTPGTTTTTPPRSTALARHVHRTLGFMLLDPSDPNMPRASPAAALFHLAAATLGGDRAATAFLGDALGADHRDEPRVFEKTRPQAAVHDGSSSSDDEEEDLADETTTTSSASSSGPPFAKRARVFTDRAKRAAAFALLVVALHNITNLVGGR